MNFLAHLYLSEKNEEILLGNFFGDFFKGKTDIERLSDLMQKGVLLHRAIDQYTDEHPVVLQSKERLRPKYRHYSPVIVDVFYDHFLAKNWKRFHSEDLLSVTESFYKMALNNKQKLPPRAQNMLQYMSRDNWLYHYQYIEGIDRALTGMSYRTPFRSKMELASGDLKTSYKEFEEEFFLFFPELQNHVNSIKDTL